MKSANAIARLREEIIIAEQQLAAASDKEASSVADAFASLDRTQAEGYLAGIQHALDILENTQ